LSVKIKVLPEIIANKIAAGEVVERPASVVKELVENSIDAGARKVVVEVQSGGEKLISVSDDGAGMGPDDALLAFERHATSKLRDAEGLSAIETLGFRGEALPSIASVSRMRLTTSDGEGSGTLVAIEGGKIQTVKEVGAAKGTLIEVRDLFFNTPARKKFLKTRETEYSHIASGVQKVALSHPEVHVRLVKDGREALECPPAGGLRDRVAQVYGREFADGMAAVRHEMGPYTVIGFVSVPGHTYSDRSRQEVFVNGRPIKAPVVTRAIYDAYRSILMKGRHPACVLFISLDPKMVDVNVHPAKREVRFSDTNGVHRAVFDAVMNALTSGDSDTSADETAYVRESAPDMPEGYGERVREAVSDYVGAADRRSAFFGKTPDAHTQERFRLPAKKRPEPDAASIDAATETRHDTGRPIQIADSYIIVPEEDGYMVIDQHAAHERIQYDRIKKTHGASGQMSQGLLVPVTLELSAKEAALMDSILPRLNDMGIEVEHFGGTSYVIRSKPLFLDKADVREVVTGVISELMDEGAPSNVDELTDRVFQLMACKSAVKAGQRLHPEAMLRLVKQLFECEMPYTCAHGRPTALKISVNELEKMFKRK